MSHTTQTQHWRWFNCPLQNNCTSNSQGHNIVKYSFQHCWVLHVSSVCTTSCVLLRALGSCFGKCGVWSCSSFWANNSYNFFCSVITEALHNSSNIFGATRTYSLQRRCTTVRHRTRGARVRFFFQLGLVENYRWKMIIVKVDKEVLHDI